MKTDKLAALWVVLMLVYGCSSIRVSQDYKASATLSDLKSYDWKFQAQAPTGDVRVDSPLLDDRIRTAVDRALRAKGCKKVSGDAPDFYVLYHYSIQKKIASDDIRTGIGFGVGSYGSRAGVSVSTGTAVRERDEGRLIIDFIDAPGGDLLWRGTGTHRVQAHMGPEKTTRNIDETVDKVLAQFPPTRK